ncbi:hypothetical protein FCV25MIE_22690 [Fagus crenata]
MVGATYPAPLPNRHAPYCLAPPRKSRICFYWLGGCTRDQGLLVGYADVTRYRCSSVCFCLATKRWISSKLRDGVTLRLDYGAAGLRREGWSE